MTAPLTALRAYPIFNTLPDGCRAFPVADDRHAPHLRAGEIAVVDPHDTRIDFGEVHVVAQSRGPCLWQVVKSQFVEGCADLHPLNLPKPGDFEAGRPVHMSDGPIYLDALEAKILGRVIGLMAPAGISLR
jgi:hypothetical protein